MKLELFTVASAAALAAAVPAPVVPEELQKVLDGWEDTPQAHYPTEFTRNIMPKQIHSHNDYWRTVPLYEALANGVISVEADVSLVDGDLFVGHDMSSLTENRTFTSLYIDPLVSILENANPTTKFVNGNTTRNGVFDTTPTQTLYLWVDLKTSGEDTFPVVIKQLEPLRERDYLTKLANGVITPGPVTVIGTGNTPLDQVAPVTTRDYFFDGPLLTLQADNITAEISPIASVDFATAAGTVTGEGLNSTQKAAIQSQVAAATELGILTRYWDLPAWPVWRRELIWRQLTDMGVFLLNADDLEAAAGSDTNICGTGSAIWYVYEADIN